MIVFDVEADGLLDQATKIHCLSYTDDGNNYKTLFDYSDMRDLILSQRGLVGHNIIRYDVPLLEKILGIKVTARLFDTLPMSWVLNYDRPKHGLESFGEDFGVPKPQIDDWENLTRGVCTQMYRGCKNKLALVARRSQKIYVYLQGQGKVSCLLYTSPSPRDQA